MQGDEVVCPSRGPPLPAAGRVGAASQRSGAPSRFADRHGKKRRCKNMGPIFRPPLPPGSGSQWGSRIGRFKYSNSTLEKHKQKTNNSENSGKTRRLNQSPCQHTGPAPRKLRRVSSEYKKRGNFVEQANLSG